MADALRDAVAVAAGDQGSRFLPVQVVELFLVQAADEGHVLEAGGGDVEHAGATSLQDGVGGDGRADDDALHRLLAGAHLLQYRGQGLGGSVGCRRLLAVDEGLAATIEPDEVGEGAAGIDPYP